MNMQKLKYKADKTCKASCNALDSTFTSINLKSSFVNQKFMKVY